MTSPSNASSRTLGCLAILLTFALSGAQAQTGPPNEQFRVDQFGYRPTAPKVAVLRSPVVGFDAAPAWAPGSPVTVRRVADETVAYSADAAVWRAGATHDQSGDLAWLFDFSAVTEEGSFYVHDEASGLSSAAFEIGPDPLADVLRAALRSLLYQRCGTPKLAEHAGADWADVACHLGAEQDLDCRPVTGPAPGTGVDLSGGWHDAGDYNKYVNYADGPVHDLLAAWRENPQAFDDAADLPESGNGVPDVLDEVKIELDWFLRMQLPDGSVRHKVSVTDFSAGSPPSADGGPRRHSEAGASSTISACGAWAHAATVLGALGHPEADTWASSYRAAALAAWDWLEANPGAIPSTYDNAGFSSSNPEQGGYEQRSGRTAAAVYLYELTGEDRFRDHVDATYNDVHLLEWGFVYPFEPKQQDAMLLYSSLAGATPAVAADIEAAYLGSLEGGDNLQHHRDGDDPYGGWLGTDDHVWGSNRTRSHAGLQYLLELRHGINAASDDELRDAGRRYLHSLHGVNPGGLVYLTNMAAAGAERSCTQVYHSWFGDGTDWDEVGASLYGPPPGILPGGPNQHFAPDPSYVGPPLEPPQNQPVQKSYLDWNTSWPENSWEVTENQVAYQAAYIRLLAWFVGGAVVGTPPEILLQPQGGEGCEGLENRVLVGAVGEDPLSYEWRFDGAALAEAPPYAGVATDTLRIDPHEASTVGDYSVLITDASGLQTLSEIATLTLRPPTGSVGDSLRLSRPPGLVSLSWTFPADADESVVFSCDASMGVCAPLEIARTAGATYDDSIDSRTLVWYEVLGDSFCGFGD